MHGMDSSSSPVLLQKAVGHLGIPARGINCVNADFEQTKGGDGQAIGDELCVGVVVVNDVVHMVRLLHTRIFRFAVTPPPQHTHTHTHTLPATLYFSSKSSASWRLALHAARAPFFSIDPH